MTNKKNQRLTIFIEPSLAKQAKAQAIVEEISLTNLIEKSLIEYLPKETIIKKVEISKKRKAVKKI